MGIRKFWFVAKTQFLLYLKGIFNDFAKKKQCNSSAVTAADIMNIRKQTVKISYFSEVSYFVENPVCTKVNKY